MTIGNNLKYAWEHVTSNYYEMTELSASSTDLFQAIALKVVLTLGLWACFYELAQFIPANDLPPNLETLRFQDLILWLVMIPISVLLLLALTSMFASNDQFLALATAQQSMDILLCILSITVIPLTGFAVYFVSSMLMFLGLYTIAVIFPFLLLAIGIVYWLYKSYKIYTMILSPSAWKARAIFVLSFTPSFVLPFLF